MSPHQMSMFLIYLLADSLHDLHDPFQLNTVSSQPCTWTQDIT